MCLDRASVPSLLAVGLFLVVVACKFATIDRFGSDLPIWDHWDASAKDILLPYLQGRLEFADFFIAHNEHRILWTKALSLGLVILNGQWDARLECLVNAVIHAAFAAGVFAYGRRLLPPRWWGAWLAAVFAITGPPFAWHNVVSGFHSQQYFLLWFSMLTIVLLTGTARWSWRWWLGVFCGASALVSMGAGLIAPATVVALLAVDGWPRTVIRRHWPTLLACVVLVALGWFTRQEAPQHEDLKARSIGDFVRTFWNYLQWPVDRHGWFPIIAWLPWGIVTTQVIIGRRTAAVAERVLIGAGIWALGLSAAAAYARGAGGGWPASRHADNVAIGILVNLLALLLLLSRLQLPRWSRMIASGAAVAGVTVFGFGYGRALRQNLGYDLPAMRGRLETMEANTRGYVTTLDRAWLEKEIIAYPNADILAQRLSHPELRSILPVSVRRSVTLNGASDPPQGFSPSQVDPALARRDGIEYWGSFNATDAGAQGNWRSAPIPVSDFAYWRMQVVQGSAPGDTELHLAMTDGRRLRMLVDSNSPRGTWQDDTFVAPKVAAEFVAADRGPAAWIGFTAPTEMAAGSYFAWRLGANGWLLVATGIIILLAAPLVFFRPARHQPNPPPNTAMGSGSSP